MNEIYLDERHYKTNVLILSTKLGMVHWSLDARLAMPVCMQIRMIDPFVCILKFLNYMYSTGRYKQEPENVRSYIIKIIILYYLDIYKFTLLLICVKKDSSKSVRTS